MSVDGAEALLHWYDRHARRLPWRIPPGSGEAPDPYRIWLSEVMLQQTTVAAVIAYFQRWIARWPTIGALAAASDAEVMAAWAGLGYYARARNLLACARLVAGERAERFPADEAGLRALPGIGAYTAAAIAAIAFGRPAVVVDGNVERVIARLHAVDTPLPAARRELHALAAARTPAHRSGDYAQAMMDLGATICTPRRPACALCPIRPDCRAAAMGLQESYPVKPAKRPRPHRFGTAFWVERDGHVLLRRRPPKGLLGGMRALPTGPWQDEPPGLAGAPVEAGWRLAEQTVTHVFTHFSLDLSLASAIHTSAVPAEAADEWWPVAELGEAGLPKLFARAAALRAPVPA